MVNKLFRVCGFVFLVILCITGCKCERNQQAKAPASRPSVSQESYTYLVTVDQEGNVKSKELVQSGPAQPVPDTNTKEIKVAPGSTTNLTVEKGTTVIIELQSAGSATVNINNTKVSICSKGGAKITVSH